MNPTNKTNPTCSRVLVCYFGFSLTQLLSERIPLILVTLGTLGILGILGILGTFLFGIYLSFGICYLEFQLTKLLHEWIRFFKALSRVKSLTQRQISQWIHQS